MKKKSWLNLFIIYMVLLITFVIFKFNGDFSSTIERMDSIRTNRTSGIWNLNLIPFENIMKYMPILHRPYAFANIVLNVLAFIPMGILFPLAFPKRKQFFSTIFWCILIISFIEITQFITMLGICDIDDLILNLFGAFLGYLLFIFYSKIKHL